MLKLRLICVGDHLMFLEFGIYMDGVNAPK